MALAAWVLPTLFKWWNWVELNLFYSKVKFGPSSLSKVIKKLKWQKKNIDKAQGKTKHEAPRSVNYRATQNKNTIGTTALERSVAYTTGLKAFHCINFTFCEGKVGTYSRINEYLTIYDNPRSRSFFDLCSRSLRFNIFKLLFLKKKKY